MLIGEQALLHTDLGQTLNHIGVESEPPHISPARGPPLWERCVAQVDDGV